ncbi:MAG: F0F1 ATP synthase subunit delta [Microgenomates group bacterium]|jgi:F0F1-type ATP synthase delta subunit
MVNKRLKNLIEKLVIDSFSPKGELKDVKINENIKTLKKLPSTDAIQALTLYQRGLKREINKTALEIASPTKLSSAEEKKITAVARKTFYITSVKTVLDSSLLGGLRIKIGDVVFDDTVKNKIEQMKGMING